jgi:hypothetical protein
MEQLHLVRTADRETHVLELDLGSIPPPKDIQHWRPIIETITSHWVQTNRYEGRGTLWVWRAPSQRFHALGNSIFIGQCGLPSRFLKFLQQQMKMKFHDKIAYAGTLLISPQKGWLPLLHVERNKSWKPEDTVASSWVEVEQPPLTAYH